MQNPGQRPSSPEDLFAATDASPFSVASVDGALWPTRHELDSAVVAEIAKRSAAADERGELEAGTLSLLRDAGYFGLPVPVEFGGGGAGLLDCAAVQRQLASADAALAIAVNMHLFSVGMAVEHWTRHHDACGLLLEAIATQARIVASAFAEPGLGGTITRSTVRATRTDQGYLVSGVKSPCSLAAHCDLVCLQMQLGPPEPSDLLIVVVPATSPGLRVEPSWDSLGMRASGSDTLHLEQCFISDELVFHRSEPGAQGDEVFAAGLVWFCVTTTATYLGIVKAALDAGRAGLHASTIAHLASSRAELPSVQGQLGEVVAATLSLEAACVSVAAALDRRTEDPRSLVPIALAIKHAAVDACARAVEVVAELLGGQSYARAATVARLWRDVQAGRFHPPTRVTSRQVLGRWALELPFSLELDERSGGPPPEPPLAAT